MRPNPTGRIAATLVLCALLGGCISLIPKSKPAQLYRFTASPAAAPTGPAQGAPVLAQGALAFETAAATDRILTVSGPQISYLAGARWAAPAPTLFQEALDRAFEAVSSPRLAARGSGVDAAARLDLDVQAFEARYDQGLDAAPLVVVRLSATIVRPGQRVVAGQHVFEVEARASDNRVGAIVDAYQTAVRGVLGKLVDWTAAVPAPQAQAG